MLLHAGGRENPAALDRLREMLDALCEGTRDEECTRLAQEIEAYAADLFSASAHRRYRRGGTSGTDYLRLQILRTLDALSERLRGG